MSLINISVISMKINNIEMAISMAISNNIINGVKAMKA
jgi:hypothetical protein